MEQQHILARISIRILLNAENGTIMTVEDDGKGGMILHQCTIQTGSQILLRILCLLRPLKGKAVDCGIRQNLLHQLRIVLHVICAVLVCVLNFPFVEELCIRTERADGLLIQLHASVLQLCGQRNRPAASVTVLLRSLNRRQHDTAVFCRLYLRCPAGHRLRSQLMDFLELRHTMRQIILSGCIHVVAVVQRQKLLYAIGIDLLSCRFIMLLEEGTISLIELLSGGREHDLLHCRLYRLHLFLNLSSSHRLFLLFLFLCCLLGLLLYLRLLLLCLQLFLLCLRLFRLCQARISLQLSVVPLLQAVLVKSRRNQFVIIILHQTIIRQPFGRDRIVPQINPILIKIIEIAVDLTHGFP